MCDFFLNFYQDFRTISIAMFLETILMLSFLWTRDCLGTVVDSQFSFVGWQDHSVVSLLHTVYTQSQVVQGALSTSIVCASRCFQTSYCHVYYVCRFNDQEICVLSLLYDQNTAQNGSLKCKAYKFRGDCDIDAVQNRYSGACLKCSPNCINKDCDDVRLTHGNVTGQYPLSLGGSTVHLRCDMDTDDGGWTVMQRRLDGSVEFFKGWSDYKAGFGNPTGEYWLGLDNLHEITTRGEYVLRIDMEYLSQQYYVKYSDFNIQNESDNYQMSFSTFLGGNTGDSLSWHNGKAFTTYDRDNDDNANNYDSPNCAIAFYGAWWYASCHNSNLNGNYQNTSFGKGINWNDVTGYYQSLNKVEMKLRRS